MLTFSDPNAPFKTAIRLPHAVPSVLALGAFLKSTICVTRGDMVYVSHSVGNLDCADSIARFEEMVARMCDGLAIDPELVAHDLHPDFHSTRFAQSLDYPALAVQHHHAHIAAIAAEHGVAEPVIGLALDGFGLGDNNESWGGELLLSDGATCRRLGHLARLAQPGGDIAAREPWRMAAAALHRMGRGGEIAARFPAIKPAAMMAAVLERNINCPATSSAGRLFDAACGLVGLHPVAEFEGQAPIALEKLATAPRCRDGAWTIEDGVLDLLPLLDHISGATPEDGANLFHGTLIAALADWAEQAARAQGCKIVALGGGCFLNRVLTGGLAQKLRERGLTPLTAHRVSPGDEGLSLGQAWVAACSLMK